MNKIWIKMFYNKLIEAELSGSDKEIEKCLEYKKQHLPRYIYKYRSCNKNSFNDLYNNFVHLSYPIVFNDPLDCSSVCTYEQALLLSLLDEKKQKHNHDDIIDNLQNHFWPDDYVEFVKTELLKGKPYKPILVNRIQEMGAFSKWEAQNYYKHFKKEIDKQVLIYNDDFKRKILLCSFAATVKNNLMWSHYSNSHTGFCVEYDLSLLDRNEEFLHALYPIIYTKSPMLANIKSCFYTDPTKDMLTIMNKSSDWSYEQEYRLFCSSEFKQDYFMPILPSRIFLGLNISDKDQEKIIKFAKKYYIEVRKMKINASSFSLAHERVY